MTTKICRLKISYVQEFDVEVQVGREDDELDANPSEEQLVDDAIQTALTLIVNDYGDAAKTWTQIKTEEIVEKNEILWINRSRYLDGVRYLFHTENKQ
ncbi:MAG: hypothetical protein IJO40_03750 [Thermoguttaceae bacterium]|jgi:hypothetical protein|nr:hypothetical protein [Thermoguttaceae bacterium]